MPIMSTPDGAISPGATGMRHGPFGTQMVPALPIIQLAAGMVSANRIRNTMPSTPAPVVELVLGQHSAFHFANPSARNRQAGHVPQP